MAKVTYITPNKKEIEVEANEGNLMEIAVENEIPGIAGDCGGVGSCSTCHVHVNPSWMGKVGEAEGLEKDTLEFNAEVTPCSRLSCQIELSNDLDGLVVEVAPEE